MTKENQPVVERFSEFHCPSIYYRSPERGTSGKSKMIRIATPGGDPVLIETPRLKVSKVVYDPESGNDGHIEFVFPADSQDFYDFMSAVDEYHMNSCLENSKDWFNGRELSSEFVENAYRSPIMPPKRSGAPCRLRVRLPVRYNKLQSSVYNQHLKPMTVHDSVNTSVICILRMVQLEMNKTSFECIWELEQMKIFEKRKRLTECLIKDVPEDETWMSDQDTDLVADLEP